MDHYSTLGVNKDATPDEIKKAYRKLASQHHPDKGGDVARFQEIEQAYRVLSDPAQRSEYDNPQQHTQFHWNAGNFEHGDLNDIFRQFGFGFSGSPFQRQQPKRNKDLRINIDLPLVTTLENQQKTVSVQTTNGHRETIQVNIPRGVTTGTQIKYASLGDNLFNTLPRGDLYVHFTVHNADGFVANGVDLYTQHRVNCLLAITGGTTVVNSLDGKQFILNIPQGTQPGTKFRLPQQGLFQLNSPQRGALFVQVDLFVPESLTEEQIEIIKPLTNTQ